MFQTIFKSGIYEPQGEFTREDLLEIADGYDPENIHEAPMFVGHDHFLTGEPKALAWVSGLRVSGSELQAEFKEVSPELKRMVDEKEFKRCSVELGQIKTTNSDGSTEKKWYLFAVALTNRPAVGSLPPLEFRAGSRKYSPGKFIGERVSFSITGSLNFSNNKQTKQIIMFAKLITLAAKFGIDAGTAAEDKPEPLLTNIEAKFTSMTDELAAAKTEIASLKEATARFATQRADDLVATAIAAGKVKPADKDKFKTFAALNYDDAKAMFEALPVNPALAPANVPVSPAAAGGSDAANDAKFSYKGEPLTYAKYLELFAADPKKYGAMFTDEEILKLKESENK